MTITLTNVEEAGMPETMAQHCQTLLERRIKKEFPGQLPEPGAEVTILYSEKDPLGESSEPDDNAYFIYFTVENVEPAEGGDPGNVHLALVY